MRVLPVSIPHPIGSAPLCVSSHVLLRVRALPHQASTSSDKVNALEGLRMNLVDHDVDVKVFLVIVGNNHILMSCIQVRSTCTTHNLSIAAASDVLPAATPVHSGRAHPCSVGSKMQSPPSELRRVQSGKVVRQNNVPSQKRFPVSASRSVVRYLHSRRKLLACCRVGCIWQSCLLRCVLVEGGKCRMQF